MGTSGPHVAGGVTWELVVTGEGGDPWSHTVLAVTVPPHPPSKHQLSTIPSSHDMLLHFGVHNVWRSEEPFSKNHGWLGSETYTVDQQLWVEFSKACGEYVETLVAPQIKLCDWQAWRVGHHRLWLRAGVWNMDESGAHLMKLFSVVKWGKLPS